MEPIKLEAELTLDLGLIVCPKCGKKPYPDLDQLELDGESVDVTDVSDFLRGLQPTDIFQYSCPFCKEKLAVQISVSDNIL